MNGHEFEKRLKIYARRKGLTTHYENHGKGSHGRLYLENRFTTIKDKRKEIGKGLFIAMCKQLGIKTGDLRNQ